MANCHPPKKCEEPKNKGVDIIFENENLKLSDQQTEHVLTITSAVAKEESRNISENIKWGYQGSSREVRYRRNIRISWDIQKRMEKSLLHPELLLRQRRMTLSSLNSFFNGVDLIGDTVVAFEECSYL